MTLPLRQPILINLLILLSELFRVRWSCHRSIQHRVPTPSVDVMRGYIHGLVALFNVSLLPAFRLYKAVHTRSLSATTLEVPRYRLDMRIMTCLGFKTSGLGKCHKLAIAVILSV